MFRHDWPHVAVVRQNPIGNPSLTPVDPVVDRGTGWRLLTSLVVALRSLALWCGGRWAVALENLALRQQLTVFKRTMTRRPLRSRDRRSGGCSQDGLQELVERCDPGGSVAHSSICARSWSR